MKMISQQANRAKLNLEYAVLRCSRPSDQSGYWGQSFVVVSVHNTYSEASRSAITLCNEVSKRNSGHTGHFVQPLSLISDPDTFAYGDYDHGAWLEIRPVKDGKVYEEAGPMTFDSWSSADTDATWNERADRNAALCKFEGASVDAIPGSEVDWTHGEEDS
jgi:hypothetical protein